VIAAAFVLITVAALLERSPQKGLFPMLVSLFLVILALVWRWYSGDADAFFVTAFLMLFPTAFSIPANKTRLGRICVTTLSLWLFPFFMVILSDAASWWISLGLILLLPLVAFPAVLQLPYVLLTGQFATKFQRPPSAEPDPELRSKDDGESIDYVSNFVRLGWNSLAQVARQGRDMKLAHTFSYLTSVALALSVPVAFFCAEAIMKATWSPRLVASVAVLLAVWMLLAFWAEDHLRERRLLAFQAQQDRIAAQIATSMEEHLQQQTSELSNFLLYLRTFSVTGKLGVGGIDLETAIAYHLDRVLPVIALGKPGEAFGAGRILTTDQHWQEEILQLIEQAKLIMIIPSHHEGTLWEIGQLRKGTFFDKTIFVMPPEIRVDGVWLSEIWSQAVEAAVGLGLFLPPHYPEGLMFKLDAAGQPTEHAPFGAEQFLAEVAPYVSGVHSDSHPDSHHDDNGYSDGDGDGYSNGDSDSDGVGDAGGGDDSSGSDAGGDSGSSSSSSGDGGSSSGGDGGSRGDGSTSTGGDGGSSTASSSG
jgi:hypothetical protein